VLSSFDDFSNDVSKDLLSSLIGNSRTRHFQRHNHNLWEHSFHGAQKPTKENHWHQFGDRALLKEIKDDPNQSPANRQHAMGLKCQHKSWIVCMLEYQQLFGEWLDAGLGSMPAVTA
jgi:hypothetical protein